MRVKLNNFLKQVKRGTEVLKDGVYPQIGVRVWGKGSYVRDTITGKDTQYKTLFQVRAGDLIINKIWTRNGAIAIVSEDQDGCFVSTEFPTFEIDTTQVDPNWLSLRLATEDFWHQCALASGGTSGKNRIKVEKFLDIEIELPKLDYQIEIVRYLKKNSSLLTATRNIVEDNQTFLTKIYSELFQPYHQVNKKAPLSDLADFIDYRGKTPIKVNSGIPLVTAKNIKFGFFSEEPKEFISKNDYKLWMTRGFPVKGDILITTEAPLGNVCFVPDFNFALAQRAICLHLKNRINSEYLFYYLISPEFQTQLVNLSTGTTAKGIKASRLKKIEIPIAELKTQIQIAKQVKERMEKFEQIKRILADLYRITISLENSLTTQRIENV